MDPIFESSKVPLSNRILNFSIELLLQKVKKGIHGENSKQLRIGK